MNHSIEKYGYLFEMHSNYQGKHPEDTSGGMHSNHNVTWIRVNKGEWHSYNGTHFSVLSKIESINNKKEAEEFAQRVILYG